MKYYLKWEAADKRIVNADEFRLIIDSMRGVYKECSSKTCLEEWADPEFAGGYRVGVAGSWQYLNILHNDGEHLRMEVLMCHKYKSADEYKIREDLDIRPWACQRELTTLFREYTGVTLCAAFKTTPSSDYIYNVPKSVYYHDRRLAFKNIPCRYIDVSSMFPACACGRLPDAHHIQEVQGRALPNEEYPFAFYMRSHHVAEYGVFDTHDYLSLPSEFFRWQCFTDKNEHIYVDVPDDQEVTILMKASKYRMTRVFRDIYRRKNEGDPLAKAIANIGIGTLHPNPANRQKEVINAYYHLAAIILGRANAKMYAMIDKIRQKGYKIISCIVDSIIYVGDETFGLPVKKLGEFYDEYGEEIYIRCADVINKYVLFDKDRHILKYVLSGVKSELQNINVPEDIDNYFRKGFGQR